MYKWFKDFLGYKESNNIEIVPKKVESQERERVVGDFATEIGIDSLFTCFLVTYFRFLKDGMLQLIFHSLPEVLEFWYYIHLYVPDDNTYFF